MAALSSLRDRLLTAGQSVAEHELGPQLLQPLAAPRAAPPMQRGASGDVLRATVPRAGSRAGSPAQTRMALETAIGDHSIAEMSTQAAADSSGDVCSKEELESLDYDPVVNTVYMSWLEHTYAPSRRRLLGYSGRTFARWLLCWILGIVIGAFAFVISWSVEVIGERREEMFEVIFSSLGRGRSTFALAGALFCASNLALALATVTLVHGVSPQAAGSGLPQVRAYLNGVHMPRVLSSACLLVKVLGTVLSVGSLLAIGPEGPLVHIGAIVGSGLTRGRKHLRLGWPFCKRGTTRTFSLSWPWVGHFRNDVDRRDFISIGAAAGFSAAFGSPIGGVLYCLEECSSFWSQQLVWRALTSTTVSSVTLMLLRSWQHGIEPRMTNFGLLSLESISVGQLHSGRHMSSLLELLLYAALGAAGGLLGALWCRAYAWLGHRRPRSRRGRLVEMALISLATSLLLFALPLLLGHCTRADKKTWKAGGFGTQFGCDEGHVDELASLLLTNREMAIKQMISKPENFDGHVLLAAALAFLPLMAMTFGAATPAGIFMPTIFIGCALGGIVGQLLRARLGGDKVTEGTFALMGAVAMLGGVQLLVPIIVTTVMARYVGNLFSEGVVELAVELHRSPYSYHTSVPTPTPNLTTIPISCYHYYYYYYYHHYYHYYCDYYTVRYSYVNPSPQHRYRTCLTPCEKLTSNLHDTKITPRDSLACPPIKGLTRGRRLPPPSLERGGWASCAWAHFVLILYLHLSLSTRISRRPRIPMVVTPTNNRLARYRASEIMSSPVISIDRRARVRHVIATLASCRHNGFPVVDPSGALAGTVLRSQLLALLHNPQTIMIPLPEAGGGGGGGGPSRWSRLRRRVACRPRCRQSAPARCSSSPSTSRPWTPRPPWPTSRSRQCRPSRCPPLAGRCGARAQSRGWRRPW
ncbi:chloride channel [Pavlovales sp. CCMP2436]|nr:chloride channel [Pavlovales sp. CCMP2436]